MPVITGGDFRFLVGLKEEGVRNYIEFNNVAENVFVSSVEGLETAPIRNNYGDWSGRDGGYMSSQLYSARTLTVKGNFYDSTASCLAAYQSSDYYSIRERIVNALRIRKLYPIFVKFMNGKCFYTEGYLTDLQMALTHYASGDYQATFYCPDAALAACEIYGDKSSIWKYATIEKERFGGHLVPEDLPVLFEDGSSSSSINYKGTLPCYPVITLKGPAKNPTFINASTNMTFKMGETKDADGNIVDFELAPNQTLTIDMENKQVFIGNKSASMYINDESKWLYLQPGTNRIFYKTDLESDTNKASVRYKELYTGV